MVCAKQAGGKTGMYKMTSWMVVGLAVATGMVWGGVEKGERRGPARRPAEVERGERECAGSR